MKDWRLYGRKSCDKRTNPPRIQRLDHGWMNGSSGQCIQILPVIPKISKFLQEGVRMLQIWGARTPLPEIKTMHLQCCYLHLQYIMLKT